MGKLTAMGTRGVVAVLLNVGVLAGCGSDRNSGVDIARIAEVKASFGPQFSVTEVAPTGIDPKVLSGQKLPEGLTFQPPGCVQFASGQLVPTGTEGNMAALSAEGVGRATTRAVVISGVLILTSDYFLTRILAPLSVG